MKKHCLSLLLCAALLLSCLPAAAENTEPSSDVTQSEQPMSAEQTDVPDETSESDEAENSAESELSAVSEEESETSEEENSQQTETEVPEENPEKLEDIQQTPETDVAEDEKDSEEEPQLPEVYTLTFLDGLTGERIDQRELTADASLEEYEFRPELPDGYSEEGYSFDGWYDLYGNRFEWDRTMPEEDLTLTAHWVVNEFQVRIYPDLENLMEDAELLDRQTVEYGEYANEPILPEYEDRVFDGWYCYSDGEPSSFDFNDEIVEDTDIYAVWEQTEIVVEVIHYIETEESYEIYESIQLDDWQIGEEFTAETLDISGYAYNAQKSVISGLLTAEDYSFDLYYDREVFPYEFLFLDADTGESLLESVSGTALYQEEVQLQAPEISGYSVVDEDIYTLVIEDDAEKPEQNRGIFYYSEDKATVSYQLTGACEGAELSSEQEVLFVFHGEAAGAALTLQNGYLFGGWYFDEECTEPVPDEWVDADYTLIPGKDQYVYEDTDVHYADAVYYAKIIDGCADLVISASSAESDCTQTFLYHVRGTDENTEAIDLVVAVKDERVVIRDLPIGTYSIREITGWSWRYRAVEDELNVMVDAGEETIAAFTHERMIDHWLSGVADFFRKWIIGND